MTTTLLPRHPLLAQYHTTPSHSVGVESHDKGAWLQDKGAKKPGGLALLVEKCFGKPLDKSQQLSDWEKRPLTHEQIIYAGIQIVTYSLGPSVLVI